MNFIKKHMHHGSSSNGDQTSVDDSMLAVTLNGKVLAKAPKNTVEKVEGNWYFKSADVDKSHFKDSNTQYTCPWKGVCRYFDYTDDAGKVWHDLAWDYPNPKKGGEIVTDRVAFYVGKHPDLKVGPPPADA